MYVNLIEVNCPGEFKNIACVRMQQNLQDQEVINKNSYLSIFFLFPLKEKTAFKNPRRKRNVFG